MKNVKAKTNSGLTLVEVLLVVGVLVILAVLILPYSERSRARANFIYCNNCLKQVGLAFRIWAGDNNENYPMSVSTLATNGGAQEIIGQRFFGGNGASNKGIFFPLLVMSNELSTPKILLCPSEYEFNRSEATTFSGMNTKLQTVFKSDLNLSYFVGVDAADIYPQMLLAGDHNLGNAEAEGGVPTKAFQTAQEKNEAPFQALGTNNNRVGFLPNQHDKQGNVLMADGSVMGFNNSTFRAALANTGDTFHTNAWNQMPPGQNRLQFP